MESNNLLMRNVITTLHMVFLTSMHLYLIIEKFGIIKMQSLKVSKKHFQILIGLKHLGTRTQTKTVNLDGYIIMNIFRNYIPHKTKKLDYKTPEWMNTLIIYALKQCSILVKRYYRNRSEKHKETLLNQQNNCTKHIIETKQNYIAEMS